MKPFYIVLILFIIALVAWPKAVFGLIFVFCVLGVIALSIGKNEYKKNH